MRLDRAIKNINARDRGGFSADEILIDAGRLFALEGRTVGILRQIHGAAFLSFLAQGPLMADTVEKLIGAHPEDR